MNGQQQNLTISSPAPERLPVYRASRAHAWTLSSWLCLLLALNAPATSLAVPVSGAALTGQNRTQLTTTVRAIRITRENSSPVAIIEVNGQAAFTHFTLPNPHRLVVDIHRAQQIVGRITRADEHVVISAGEGGIERVRIGQMGSKVRIVFDMVASPRYRIERQGENLIIRFSAPPHTSSAAPSRAPATQTQALPPVSVTDKTAIAARPETATASAHLSASSPDLEALTSPLPQPPVATKPIAEASPSAPPSASPEPTAHNPAFSAPSANASIKPVSAALPIDKSQIAPPVDTRATAAKSGKRHFKEGMKYEIAGSWDLAAREFALAAAAEPGNTEYRLHLLRAMQQASIMLTKRGDALVAKQDYAGAYAAYHQAFSYDPTNELARVKMERASSALRPEAGERANYDPRTGNFVATGADIRLPQQADTSDLAQAVNFKDASLKQIIEQLAAQLNLNVLFDESFKNIPNFQFKLRDVTLARALDMLLLQTKHLFEQIDRRTILIYADNPVNRQRFEQLLVKTFYLGNVDLEQASKLLQTITGVQRQVIPIKQLNALVVRDTPRNLRMFQELLDSIDKNRPEVVIDVNIYEVSHSTALELGNQLALTAQPVTETRFDADGRPVTVTVGNSASLGNLGGIGRAGLAALAGATASPLLGGVGTIIGLPPSSLSLLQSRGRSKLLASTQIHALDGEQNQTKVGRSVPVRIGTNYIPGYVAQAAGATAATTGANLLGAASSGAFDSIQYKDVGLVIDVIPTITKDGYVQIKMKLESTSVEASGADLTLTPSFTQRSLTTIARIQDGQTAVVAGIKQENKGETRAGIPVLGMIPLLGRFLTTPKESSSLSDIIITVTPHIIRSTALKQEDHLARLGGNQIGGLTPSIEDVLLQQSEAKQPSPSPHQPVQASSAPSHFPADQEAKSTTTAPHLSSKLEPALRPVASPAQPASGAEPTSSPAASEHHSPAVIALKLTPSISTQQAGQSFLLTLTVTGQATLTGATLLLKFDATKLQLKAVRDGGLLGNRAELNHYEQDGDLLITLQQTSKESQPKVNGGQLLHLEFIALSPGQVAIDFDLTATELVLEAERHYTITASGARVEIVP